MWYIESECRFLSWPCHFCKIEYFSFFLFVYVTFLFFIPLFTLLCSTYREWVRINVFDSHISLLSLHAKFSELKCSTNFICQEAVNKKYIFFCRCRAVFHIIQTYQGKMCVRVAPRCSRYFFRMHMKPFTAKIGTKNKYVDREWCQVRATIFFPFKKRNLFNIRSTIFVCICMNFGSYKL